MDRSRILIGRGEDVSPDQALEIREVLLGLKPWRKGPFDIFGISIDSEWDSALKWRRVEPHLAPLGGRKVLDVGCANGYYLFRMSAAGPQVLLGIEPYAAYYFQFLALQHFARIPHLYCLPLRLADLAAPAGWFDTVFCMGVLYHSRSPLETLGRLRALLSPGGQLVLETLVLTGEAPVALCPASRYAGMRNVYFIPTVPCLEGWLERYGFMQIRCVDVTPTTPAEQRRTEWIDSESLESFLNPLHPELTREGHPAPLRAVVTATVKG